jgi:GNAT superfamily N-acetyltransferase
MTSFPDSGITLRLFRSTDSVRGLTGLLHRAYAPLAAMGLNYTATDQDDETTRPRVATDECYVGEVRGVIVATVCFVPAVHTRGCPWYDRPEVASFHQFAVEPALQGRGIRSALVTLVESRARETGPAELALDTAEPADHLIRFYERRGYRFIEFAHWEGKTYRSVILSKPLAPNAPSAPRGSPRS